MKKIIVQHIKNLKFHKKWTVSFLQLLHTKTLQKRNFFLFLVEKKNDSKLRKNFISFSKKKKKKFFAIQYLYLNTILIYLFLSVQTYKNGKTIKSSLQKQQKTAKKKNLYHKITEKRILSLSYS